MRRRRLDAVCDGREGSDCRRRAVVCGGVAALGMAALRMAPASVAAFGGAAAGAQTPVSGRIDVHHHIIPPVQRAALESRNLLTSRADWSVAASLEDMDKAAVATAIVSVLNPGVWFGQSDQDARRLARECNEFAATLVRDHLGARRSVSSGRTAAARSHF